MMRWWVVLLGWSVATLYSSLWPSWWNLAPPVGLALAAWVLQEDAWLRTKMVLLIAMARTVLFAYRGQLTPGFILEMEIAAMAGQAVLQARTHAQRVETLRACHMVTGMIRGGCAIRTHEGHPNCLSRAAP